jgi:hypothetical protein
MAGPAKRHYTDWLRCQVGARHRWDEIPELIDAGR